MLQSCLITGGYPNYWPEAAFAGETDANLGENQSRMHFCLLRPCEVVGIPIPNSSNLVLACANHVCMSQTSSKSSFRVGGPYSPFEVTHMLKCHVHGSDQLSS